MWEILASGGEVLWKLKQQVPLSLEFFLQTGLFFSLSSGIIWQPRLLCVLMGKMGSWSWSSRGVSPCQAVPAMAVPLCPTEFYLGLSTLPALKGLCCLASSFGGFHIWHFQYQGKASLQFWMLNFFLGDLQWRSPCDLRFPQTHRGAGVNGRELCHWIQLGAKINH